MYEPVSTLSATVCRNTSTPRTSAILSVVSSIPKNIYIKKGWVHLLSLPLQIRVYQRNMIVTANHIAQRRQPLFYALDLDRLGDCVSQVLQFLVCGRCGHQQAFAVST